MHVLFAVPGDRSTASTRYRILNILPYLVDSGHSYDLVSLKKRRDILSPFERLATLNFLAEMLFRSLTADVVVIQKIPLPAAYVHLLSKFATVIYDFDDALYTSPTWDSDNPKQQERLKGTIASSEATVAGSDVLVDFAKTYTDEVYRLPTPIPLQKYEDPSKPAEEGLPNDEVTIGWIGNQENLHYLDDISHALKRTLDEHTESRLLVITATERPLSPLEERDDVTYVTWSLEKEIEYLSRADIAIRPLRDDEWTRGKGGYTSVVQSMALRIPVIVTPVGALEKIVTHGESGYHARKEAEWTTYLSTLIEDVELRHQMGESAFQAVDRQGFWTETTAPNYVEIIESVHSTD